MYCCGVALPPANHFNGRYQQCPHSQLQHASGRAHGCCVLCRAGMLRELRSQALRDGFVQPADADAVEALAASFVAAIRAGNHSDLGWSNSMYGISKLAEISYTRWLARSLSDQVRLAGMHALHHLFWCLQG